MSDDASDRKALIDDLKKLIEKNGKVTRDYYREHGSFSEKFIAKHFASFKEFIAVASGLPDSVEPITEEWIGDTLHITLPKTRIKTLEELIETRNIDLTVWEVERFKAKQWEMGAMPKAVGSTNNWTRDNTDPIVVPLFAIEATFVKRVKVIAIREEIESLKEDAKKFARKPLPAVTPSRNSGNMLEIVIPDLHSGKLSWHEETGAQDWDTKLAEEAYYKALATILERSSEYQIDKIVLVVGNDLLNSDNLNSTTTKGTVVNTDTRFQKTYRTVRRMLVTVVEHLRTYAPVVVKVVPGNHDTLSDFTLGDSLECWFWKYDDVEIDNTAIQHKTFKWGDVFLLWVHGDKGKRDDYGLWMATEYPKEFGDSRFREIHCGHTHKTKVDEKFGVRVRTLSALTPPDAWHANNNFVGNLRVAEGFIWNKEQGLISIVFHTELD